MGKKQLVKEWRKEFNKAVFGRDGGRCVMCSEAAVDAHHITDRHEMPNDGYVVENGISLCAPCHELAEQFHATGVAAPGFSPEELYVKVRSSKELAIAASKRLSR